MAKSPETLKKVIPTRKGRWPKMSKQEKEEFEKFCALPPEIQKLMKEVNPEWDWKEISVDGNLWLIIRQYEEEEEEISRVAAIVKAHRYLK